VIQALAEVYKHDATCRHDQLSPAQRLSFHQEHGQPIMEGIQRWMNEQFASPPTSALAKQAPFVAPPALAETPRAYKA
jgi:hypothetical protein